MVAGRPARSRGISAFFVFSAPVVRPPLFTGGMNVLHEVLGLALLATGALAAAGAGLGALVGLGRLERRLVPARVENDPRPRRSPDHRP